MMYVCFPLLLRNGEDCFHERGIEVSHEIIRHGLVSEWEEHTVLRAPPARAHTAIGIDAQKQLFEKQLRRLLRKQKIAAVLHGFRSSFRDWAAVETNHPREVIEAALAHVVQNKVEAAYARSDLFERRRILMDDWASYLAEETATDSESARQPSVL